MKEQSKMHNDQIKQLEDRLLAAQNEIGTLRGELENQRTTVTMYQETVEDAVLNVKRNEYEIINIKQKMQQINLNNNPRHSVSTIDISKPVFFGNNRDIHPKNFLERLEEYF